MVNGDFTVNYETKQGMKTSVFYNQGDGKRDNSIAGQIEILPQYKRYDRANSLARKLKNSPNMVSLIMVSVGYLYKIYCLIFM